MIKGIDRHQEDPVEILPQKRKAGDIVRAEVRVIGREQRGEMIATIGNDRDDLFLACFLSSTAVLYGSSYECI